MEKHLVFVYGSCKKGFGNHRVLSGAKLVHKKALTAKSYTLVSLGSFPGVVQQGTTIIEGEVYEVDEAGLTRLDRLEGHPSFYERKLVDIPKVGQCWLYMLPEVYLTNHPIKEGVWHNPLHDSDEW